MRSRHTTFASITLAGALALSGCASAAEPVAAEPTAELLSTDVQACTGFNDVLTIVANADAGLGDGRMAEQERQGWYRLAARVLDALPTSDDGAVSEGIVALKEVAPAVKLGAIQPSQIDSMEWHVAVEELGAACTAIDVETAVEKFTGG